jgi:hypothetical protein
MRYQSLLVISTALHGSQNIFEVSSDAPALRAGGLGEPHRFENHQPLSRTPFCKRYPWPQACSAWVLRDREKWGRWLAAIVGIALDNAIK